MIANPDLLGKGLELYKNRPDKDWSLTDCLSFVVITQHFFETNLPRKSRLSLRERPFAERKATKSRHLPAKGARCRRSSAAPWRLLLYSTVQRVTESPSLMKMRLPDNTG